MDNTHSLPSQSFGAQAWAQPQTADAHQQMFGQEAKDWSLLRLVLAAGLTVLALGVIAAVYP